MVVFVTYWSFLVLDTHLNEALGIPYNMEACAPDPNGLLFDGTGLRFPVQCFTTHADDDVEELRRTYGPELLNRHQRE